MIGQRQGKPVEVTAQSYGEDVTYRLRPLSALEVDQIRNAYPPPLPPREVVDGETKINDKDETYTRQRSAWEEQFLLLQVCRQIGAQEFGTDDLLEQITLLKADHTERELIALVTKAILIGRGEITDKTMADAKERLVPFVNAAPEGAPTAP